MSKRNNKRTPGQRKAARLIKGGAEVDPGTAKYLLLQEGRAGATGPGAPHHGGPARTLGACGALQADSSAPRPTSPRRGTAGSMTTPR